MASLIASSLSPSEALPSLMAGLHLADTGPSVAHGRRVLDSRLNVSPYPSITLPVAALCCALALIWALPTSAILSTTLFRLAVPVDGCIGFAVALLAAFWSWV
jgi:hypothetical protein